MDIGAIFKELSGGMIIWVVLTLTAADVILGIMQSLKTHRFKSSINKAGIINKCGVVVSIVFFYVLDLLLGIEGIGFSELFGTTIGISELISIIYNLKVLEVPIPNSLMTLLDKFTEEQKTPKE